MVQDIQKIYELMDISGYNQYVGGGPPDIVARDNFKIVVALANLTVGSTILDFGCGCGRNAINFLQYIGPKGKLYGVDIREDLIAFCNEQIKPIFPNSEFIASGAPHEWYNTSSNIGADAEKAIFDAFKGKVDLAVAFSVFSHLDPKETAYYFKQLATAVKDDGAILFSCFLLDPMSLRRLSDGFYVNEIRPPLPKESDDFFFHQTATSHWMGHSTRAIQSYLLESGLYMSSVLYGTWRTVPIDSTGASSYQDVVVAKKIPVLPQDFNSELYASLHTDLQNMSMDPKIHYLLHGRKEGRRYK